MKVGDYVRTKDGYIYKIEDGEEFYEDYVDVGIGTIPDVDGIWVDKEHFQYVDKREIVKSSPNIINLIEVGDYVNGYKVIDIVKEFKVIIDELELDTTTGLYHNIGITNIKSIVTKEQFESMEYKVKE